MNKIATVTFSVSGYVTQKIEITDPKLTIEELKKGLNNGTYATTLHDEEAISRVKDGTVVAKIINTDNNCEYDDFDVEEE